MAPTNKRSSLWLRFTEKTSKEAICKFFGVLEKLGGGTSNFKGHLQRNHPGLDNSINKCSDPEVQNLETSSSETEITSSFTASSTSSQPSIIDAFDKQNQFKSGGSKETILTQSLIYMICKDNLPFSCTEKTGMKKFLKVAVPRYKPPSRATIVRLIEGKYESLHLVVCGALKNLSSLALTTDIATVMNSTRSFIVLTGHYFDEKACSVKSLVFGLKELTPHHTARNICLDLKEIFDHWNIEPRIVTSVTTDNGANIVAAVKDLFPSRSNSIHVSCYAHNINLVVSKGLGAVKELVAIIEKVKLIVAFFKHSNVAQDQLRQEQEKDGRKDGTFLYLIQEVSTRWNSTLHCLQIFKELSGYVEKTLANFVSKKAPSMITSSELAIIGECIALLLPLENATNDISGDSYVSASLVIPFTHCLQLSLTKICATYTETIQLKDVLLQQESSVCFEDIILSINTVPRLKSQYVVQQI
ncbi:PREDICTED: zinc finger BED domain-containing protein 4-like [Rhagoletis zephyria]|uniref:zinc finger BED domain-containing protein 4-like n=1 Tax=Rhagoletis zephyria TaxID=28612 RepID=UPI000811243E|nr:PREDICTED: zinc finger BED domain-containing protein 4-like [Rhagoletis zephyria]